MNQDFYKKIIKHLLVVLMLLTTSFLYFSPELQGKKIASNDKIGYTGAAKEYYDYEEKGEDILWTSRIFSGMPLFQTAFSAKSNLIKNVHFYNKILPYSITLHFTLLLCFYLAMLILGIRIEVSFLFALAFGFSTWLLLSIEASHSSKVVAISYLVPLIASIHYAYNKSIGKGGILTCIFLCLLLGANHYQIAYYSLFFIVVIFLNELVNHFKSNQLKRFAKNSVILFCFGALGVLPNASRLLPTLDFSKETMRGGKSELTTSEQSESTGLNFDYAMRWSYGTLETANLIIPGLYGGGYALDKSSNTVKMLKEKGVPQKTAEEYAKSIPMYYGSQPFTSGPTYIGTGIVLLFFLMFFIIKSNIRWALLSVIILAILFSWGRNLSGWNHLFFDYFPMFNKFRAPSMWLTLVIISTTIGAALSLNNLFQRKYDSQELQKGLKIAFVSLAGFILLFLLFGEAIIGSFSSSYDSQLMKSGFPIDAIIEDRISLMRTDAFRSLVFTSLCGGVIWLWMKNKITNSKLFITCIGILILADLLFVDLRYVNSEDFVKGKDFSSFIQPTAADQQILADTTRNYRVFNTTVSTFNDNTTSYFHHSAGGYSAAKLYRYQDLIDYHLSKGNMNVFNMLNIKYFIVNQNNNKVAQKNPSAAGSAWFIKNIEWVKNADEEIAALTDFIPIETVVIDKRFKPEVNESEFPKTGTIDLVNFHPEKMTYKTSSNNKEFAVFSEIWYKGNEDWKAYLDGKEVPFLRVNYLLRGMVIPPGEHTIVFEFKPKVYGISKIISLVSSILIIILSGFFAYKSIRPKSSE